MLQAAADSWQLLQATANGKLKINREGGAAPAAAAAIFFCICSCICICFCICICDLLLKIEDEQIGKLKYQIYLATHKICNSGCILLTSNFVTA